MDLPRTADGAAPLRSRWPHWGRRTFHAFKSTNAAFSSYAMNAAWSLLDVNGLFALLAVNGVFSVGSVNSVVAFGSINSVCSAFSANCFMCIGCSGTSWCRGASFGGSAAPPARLSESCAMHLVPFSPLPPSTTVIWDANAYAYKYGHDEWELRFYPRRVHVAASAGESITWSAETSIASSAGSSTRRGRRLRRSQTNHGHGHPRLPPALPRPPDDWEMVGLGAICARDRRPPCRPMPQRT